MNEEEIFHEALARADPAERAAYLEHTCAGDPALRAAVEALLRAAVGATGNDHVYVANTLDHLASSLGRQGKHTEAESCARECLEIRRRLVLFKHMKK
jgi:hypothetical protein